MKLRRTWGRILTQPQGLIGALLLLFVMLVAFVGPLVAPYAPGEIVGATAEPASSAFPLGTDYLGRDVLSRVVEGGRAVVLIGFIATALTYLLGGFVGIYAALRGGSRDFISMRVVDIITTVPGILVLLLLANGLGQHIWVLVIGVVIVLFPPVSRVVRTAALSVSKLGYVEAAIARGDGLLTVCRRDILPNIAPNILADFGIRFSASILLVAALNFLGLGLNPPTADWGLMTSENQAYISLNVWSVVAPASMLALLTVAINLLADAYLRIAGRSFLSKRRRRLGGRKSVEGAPPGVEPTEGSIPDAGKPLGVLHGQAEVEA